MAKYLRKLTIETSETYSIRYRRYFFRAFCLQCDREVGMVSPIDAALLSGKDLNAIDDLIQTEEFHVGHFEDAGDFICLNSLCLL